MKFSTTTSILFAFSLVTAALAANGAAPTPAAVVRSNMEELRARDTTIDGIGSGVNIGPGATVVIDGSTYAGSTSSSSPSSTSSSSSSSPTSSSSSHPDGAMSLSSNNQALLSSVGGAVLAAFFL